jgi:hypothetical protein
MARKLFAALVAVSFAVATTLSAQEVKPPQPANQDNRPAQGQSPPQPSPQNTDRPTTIIAGDDKTSPAPQQDGASNKQEGWVQHLWSDLKITDILLTLFTGALAVYTYRLWRSTEKLWRAGKEQLKVSIDATNAILDANKISQSSLIFDQRAWLSVDDPRFEDDVRFVDGTCGIAFSVRITNIGKTPATSIVTNIDTAPEFAAVQNVIDSCRIKARDGWSHRSWQRTLLPGMSYRRKWGVSFGLLHPNSTVCIPIIVGATVYRTTVDSDQHCTDFEFTPGLRPGDGKGVTYLPIPTDRTTAASNIIWETGSGGSAT